jgi:predicted RNA binding protein YcfA (HicA-like mRNA interferase family)
MASTAEFLRRLTRAGFTMVYRGKKHDIYEGPGGKRVAVWRHSREIPNGTYRSMLKEAGIG